MRAVIYIRVATKNPFCDDAYKAQEQYMRKFAEENGCLITKVISETCSGSTCNRPGLTEILNAPTSSYQQVLTKDIGRIGRNTIETLNWCDKLKHSGKTLICADGSHLQLPTLKRCNESLAQLFQCKEF